MHAASYRISFTEQNLNTLIKNTFLQWAMKYARTFYGRCNNLLRTSARTHKLEMKGFRYNFVLFGVLTVISHLIQSSDLLGPLWKGKMFANIQI